MNTTFTRVTFSMGVAFLILLVARTIFPNLSVPIAIAIGAVTGIFITVVDMRAKKNSQS